MRPAYGHHLHRLPVINYVDPSFQNPRVSNLTVGVEHSFSNNWTVSANYAFVHSTHLRTGGFSTTNWYRNFIPAIVNGKIQTDPFGRTLLEGIATQARPGPPISQFAFPLDPHYFRYERAGQLRPWELPRICSGREQAFRTALSVLRQLHLVAQLLPTPPASATPKLFSAPRIHSISTSTTAATASISLTSSRAVWSSIFPGASPGARTSSFTAALLTLRIRNMDLNGDGVFNQFADNDRPVVQVGGGKPFLLPDIRDASPLSTTGICASPRTSGLSRALSSALERRSYSTLRTRATSTPILMCIGFVRSNEQRGVHACESDAVSNIECPALPAVPNPHNTPGYRTVDELAPGRHRLRRSVWRPLPVLARCEKESRHHRQADPVWPACLFGKIQPLATARQRFRSGGLQAGVFRV